MGVIGVTVAVFLPVMNGSETIEKVLSILSLVLYGVYALFLILALTHFSGDIGQNFAPVPVTGNRAMGDFRYVFYNLAIIIAVLYAIRHCETGKEALNQA